MQHPRSWQATNCEELPEGTYTDRPRWRNFFSEKLMRHFASRCGFKVVASDVTPWPPFNISEPPVDAVTLLELQALNFQG